LHILPKFKIFTTDEEFEYKDLKILPFSIQHDTVDPVGFVIKYENIKIGICTDLGFVSSLIKNILKDLDYLFIEANHHEPYVHASRRSQVYKQRVLSRQGHLSNADCLKLLEAIVHPNLKKIYLAHLSSECNSLDCVKDIFINFLKNKKSKARLAIAFQDQISEKIIF
jgi:phosphoribosyl 1,2-cyclic phosphodiesterase